MKQLALLCLMWLGVEDHGFCQELKVFEPYHVSMEYRNYEQFASLWGRNKVSYRDPYLFPLDEEITYGLGVNLDYNIFRYKKWRLLWENDWFFDSAESHVRHVGWTFSTGLNYNEHFEMGYQHQSRHVLEEARTERFPVYDRVYFKFIILDVGRK